MRLKTIAFACAAMLSLLTAPALTACASLPSFETSPLESTLVDDKALYAAEAAYFGAATAADVAVDSGVLTGERAGQVAALLERGYTSLGVARSAYRAGNARSAQTAAAEALAAIAGAQRILKPSPPG